MKREQIETFVRNCIVDAADRPAETRVRAVVLRLLADLLTAIDELDIQPCEFWSAVDFIGDAAVNDELEFITACLGIDRFLDLRADLVEAAHGMTGATPRAIEGSLYVSGAPESVGYARMDDGTEEAVAPVLFLQGKVTDLNGRALPGAKVEIWQANAKGAYSYFDESQSDFNLRRTVVTDEKGRYQVRTTVPKGCSVPEGGLAECLLQRLGRHGHRPALIHVSASMPGHRKLTTQIGIEGGEHLYDDCTFSMRDGLIPPVEIVTDPQILTARGLDESFASIDFDIRLYAENDTLPTADVCRRRAGG